MVREYGRGWSILMEYTMTLTLHFVCFQAAKEAADAFGLWVELCFFYEKILRSRRSSWRHFTKGPMLLTPVM